MSNNNNDLDNDIDLSSLDEGGFEDFNKKESLGDVWRNNPMIKVGAVLVGVAALLGAVILFGGGGEKPPVSSVTTTASVTEAPGSGEISETYRQAIEEANIQNTEEALRTGGSSIPMPVSPAKETLPAQFEQAPAEDPLERWKRMQEERAMQQDATIQQTQQAQQAQQQAVDTRTPAVSAMAEAMAGQMESILQGQKIPPVTKIDVAGADFLEGIETKRMETFQQQQQVAAAAAAATQVEQIENILIPSGTIEYGQLLIEANTDAPGPVLAQILSGPLRGARLIGSFQSTDNYITLNFNKVIIDGLDYDADAVAIDPQTTLPGLVTEIDRRYFKRIVLPMAAEFVSGLADAISESGTTSITIQGETVTESQSAKSNDQEVASGITEAGDALSEILEEEADNTKPLLRIATGTPIGVLFVAPVVETAQ
jgi:intracellular multiplication protein IcmE